MSAASKRSTIYFDPDLHAALRLKEERVAEATITYETLLNDLKKHGKL